MASIFDAQLRTTLLGVTVALLLMLPATSPTEDDPLGVVETQVQALFEKIAPSMVFIAQSNSMGSCSFVTDDGLALTNAHVVEQASAAQVVLRDGRTLTAIIVARAADHVDLALILRFRTVLRGPDLEDLTLRIRR